MGFNLADLFEQAVDTVPEREALVCGRRRLTYAQLEERANRLAHHLLASGLGKGDHVGIYAYNCAEWVESMLAAFKMRAVPININFRYVEEELLYLFDNADLVALIHQRQFCPRIAAIRDRVPKLRHFIVIDDGTEEDCSALGSVEYEAALASASPERDFGPRSPDDLYILYTGGTTGMPKGVMWRQEDVFFALGGGIDPITRQRVQRPEEMAEKAKAGPQMTSLPAPPLMHGAAQWGVLGALFVGNRVVLYPGRHFDAHEIWKLVERERVNTMSITGDAMARPLAEALAAPGASYDLSSLRAISSTAAVFSPVIKEQIRRFLPHVVITDAVGASESGFNALSFFQQAGSPSGGQGGGLRGLMPGADVAVLDDDLRPVRPGSGVVGRLARRGNIPLGYYKDPEKTARTFVEVDGVRWSIPGDMAMVEEDGSIVLLGRGSQCINSGGEKIFPEEVEAALKSHPDVFDAVVVGVPDERWGERVAAVVQPRPGRRPTLEELDAHCRGEDSRVQGAAGAALGGADTASAQREAGLPLG